MPRLPTCDVRKLFPDLDFGNSALRIPETVRPREFRMLIEDKDPLNSLRPTEPETYGVRYQGSKSRILREIESIIAGLGIRSAVDVFSGTTRVAQYLRRLGITVTTSDLSCATTAYAHTFVHNPDNRHLLPFVEEMNRLHPLDGGWISRNYTGEAKQHAMAGKGRCFQLENACHADAVLAFIAEQPSLALWEKCTLLTSAIMALDRVDNTIGIQQSYLKQYCNRSFNKIIFNLPPCILGPTATHTEGDALRMRYGYHDLAYCDPPYSSHSYANYYHIYDSIVRGDKPETALTSRRRVDRVARNPAFDTHMRSRWNNRREVLAAFEALLDHLRTTYILVSYSDEGLVEISQLLCLCSRYGKIINHLSIPCERHRMSQIGNAAIGGTQPEKGHTYYEHLILIETLPSATMFARRHM